jgi:hypothetical protein
MDAVPTRLERTNERTNEWQGSESENEMSSQKEETRLNSIPVTKTRAKTKTKQLINAK